MVNLFQSLWISTIPERHQELMKCLDNNIANPLIDRIIILTEDKLLLDCFEKDPNIKVVVYYTGPDRPTFNEFFKWTREGDTNIIANADIYFDDTLQWLICNPMNEKVVFALSRWDEDATGAITHYNHLDSQDAWIMFDKFPEIKDADFTMGVPGCDNRIAYLLARSGLIVSNPSKTIRAIHLHNSGIRTYEKKDTIPPPYKLITPHEY